RGTDRGPRRRSAQAFGRRLSDGRGDPDRRVARTAARSGIGYSGADRGQGKNNSAPDERGDGTGAARASGHLEQSRPGGGCGSARPRLFQVAASASSASSISALVWGAIVFALAAKM